MGGSWFRHDDGLGVELIWFCIVVKRVGDVIMAVQFRGVSGAEVNDERVLQPVPRKRSARALLDVRK
jgi:hypothetical protein